MSTAVNIHYDKVVVQPLLGERQQRKINEKSLNNLIRSNNYNGYLSSSTEKKLKAKISALCHHVTAQGGRSRRRNKKKRNIPIFITLTLSYQQIQNDNYIKRNLLGRFIEYMCEEHNIEHYIWRAEPQKNGNLHFHILADKYVPWKWIRETWNNIQARHEYIDAFEEKNGHRDPNSTDVHALRNINNISAYICKYMAKNEVGRVISGRIWGCSKQLHSVKTLRCMMVEEVSKELDSQVLEGNMYKKEYEYCTVYYVKQRSIETVFNSIIYDMYDDYIYGLLTKT